MGQDTRCRAVPKGKETRDMGLANRMTTDRNINWVFGSGEAPQQFMDPRLYLGLYTPLMPILVYLPMHTQLKRLFGRTASS
jgi:hypothetical protein